MTTDIDKALAPVDQFDGLSRTEYQFLSRLMKVCTWLATLEHKQVVERCMDDFDCSEQQAEKWIVKGGDYMALGCFDDADQAKKMYYMRLNRILSIAEKHIERDTVIEVTQKPTKLKIEADPDHPDHGKTRIVHAPTSKVRRDVFDKGAADIALKAMKEMAHITGGRPKEVRSITNNNLFVNSESAEDGGAIDAQSLSEQSNEQLARLLGVEHVEVLPGDIIDIEPEAESSTAGESRSRADAPQDSQARQEHEHGPEQGGEDENAVAE